jgi:hypothetical protein
MMNPGGVARSPERAKRALLVLALALWPAALPALAHHSLAAYDRGRNATLEGVISAFHFAQPHPYLMVRVGAESWRMELDNLWELAEIGIDRNTFRPGDRIVVRGDPMRDGSRQVYVWRLDRPADGLLYEQIGFNPRLTKGR